MSQPVLTTYIVCLSRPWIEHPTFCLQGKRSNRLRHRRGNFDTEILPLLKENKVLEVWIAEYYFSKCDAISVGFIITNSEKTEVTILLWLMEGDFKTYHFLLFYVKSTRFSVIFFYHFPLNLHFFQQNLLFTVIYNFFCNLIFWKLHTFFVKFALFRMILF